MVSLRVAFVCPVLYGAVSFFLFGYAKGAHPPQQLSRVTPAAGARRLSLTNEDAYGAVVYTILYCIVLQLWL
jgi:hypothetical protein